MPLDWHLEGGGVPLKARGIEWLALLKAGSPDVEVVVRVQRTRKNLQVRRRDWPVSVSGAARQPP